MKLRANWPVLVSIAMRYAWVGEGYRRKMSPKEIAEALECTPMAVRTVASRLYLSKKRQPKPGPVEQPTSIITLAGPEWSLPERIGEYEVRAAVREMEEAA